MQVLVVQSYDVTKRT